MMSGPCILCHIEKEMITVWLLFGLLCSTAAAQDVQAARIRAHTRFLSHDLLEGRGVGTRGGDLATEYIATQFALAGLKPGGDNETFFQAVPLVGVSPDPTTRLEAIHASGRLEFAWAKDFVGVTETQRAEVQLDAEAIFVGHGIVAPEYDWDDFKGVDVKGKILILFTNEPPSTDPRFFQGRALTYYGRWTYKYEQAARLGAAGCIIIHTPATAGYGWDVVRNSWGKENMQMRLLPGAPALQFAGWVTSEAGARLLALSGHKMEELLAEADKREFRPTPLGIRIRASLRYGVREVVSRNVIGIAPGSDPALSQEAVLFTAHWDHLGIGTPVNGDPIYNGALDNATGCALLLEMAHAWAALERKPRRSAVFIALTAEESGLLGSEYYVRRPVTPLGKTAVALNFDALYPLGLTSDITAPGAERTSIWPLLQSVAKRRRFTISPDPRPEAGSYFRSDHFPLARAGVPAFSIGLGRNFLGRSPEATAEILKTYGEKHYHQPSDEFRSDWDFSGLEALARFAIAFNMDVANMDALPTWNEGDEYQPIRQRSLEAH